MSEEQIAGYKRLLELANTGAEDELRGKGPAQYQLARKLARASRLAQVIRQPGVAEETQTARVAEHSVIIAELNQEIVEALGLGV